MCFKKKNNTEKTEVKTETAKPAEEWIWVTGYKATDKDMKCRDYQYELNKCFDISEETTVETCTYGFHLCKYLKDVYNYYPIGNGNRFFEVRALVRKEACENYVMGNGQRVKFHNGHACIVSGCNKLAAKSIIFVRELSIDEILGHVNDTSDWSDDDKRFALEVGISKALFTVNTRKLVEIGYSPAFAKIIVKDNKFDIAYAVGTQEGLSMDMKVWAIYNSDSKVLI